MFDPIGQSIFTHHTAKTYLQLVLSTHYHIIYVYYYRYYLIGLGKGNTTLFPSDPHQKTFTGNLYDFLPDFDLHYDLDVCIPLAAT